MLPLASRRIAARCVRVPPPSLRYASTKPKASSKAIASAKPNANRGAKAQITRAFTEPAPPILARWPNVYWAVQYLILGTGAILAFHIWSEYFFTFSQAEGISMTPIMNGTGDWLLLSKMYRRGRYVKVGDLVSFKHPIDEGTFGVKRVIGMPGDFVLRDTPGTSGVMIQVRGIFNGTDNGRALIELLTGTRRTLLDCW